MKLNHINLPVEDIAASRDFLAKYFGMETVMERGKNVMAILRDEGGMVLILSHFAKEGEILYHKDFHVGFFLDSREEVDAIHARMAADGIEAAPPKKMPGRWAFYVDAPGGFIAEVAMLDRSDWAP